MMVFSGICSVSFGLWRSLGLDFPGVPRRSVAGCVVKNRSRSGAGGHWFQSRERFAFLGGYIVTLAEGLCKWFLREERCSF